MNEPNFLAIKSLIHQFSACHVSSPYITQAVHQEHINKHFYLAQLMFRTVVTIYFITFGELYFDSIFSRVRLQVK
jgi:hypothetical protein